MTRTLPIFAVALVFGAASLAPAAGQGFVNPMMYGMMGGGCPTVGMMGQGMMGFGNGPGIMMGQPQIGAMVEGRLAYLKRELGIAQEQEKAWTAYAEATQVPLDTMQSMHQSMVEAFGQGSALERMDARITSMESMLEAMKALRPATEALYAALDDEQKAKADYLIGLECGPF